MADAASRELGDREDGVTLVDGDGGSGSSEEGSGGELHFECWGFFFRVNES